MQLMLSFHKGIIKHNQEKYQVICSDFAVPKSQFIEASTQIYYLLSDFFPFHLLRFLFLFGAGTFTNSSSL